MNGNPLLSSNHPTDMFLDVQFIDKLWRFEGLYSSAFSIEFAKKLIERHNDLKKTEAQPSTS